jgi:hypothetical protein
VSNEFEQVAAMLREAYDGQVLPPLRDWLEPTDAAGAYAVQPCAAPSHLDVKPCRLGRAQHGDQVHGRGVEAGGQHPHRCQRADLAGLELRNDAVALVLGGIAKDRGATDPAPAEYPDQSGPNVG